MGVSNSYPYCSCHLLLSDKYAFLVQETCHVQPQGRNSLPTNFSPIINQRRMLVQRNCILIEPWISLLAEMQLMLHFINIQTLSRITYNSVVTNILDSNIHLCRSSLSCTYSNEKYIHIVQGLGLSAFMYLLNKNITVLSIPYS